MRWFQYKLVKTIPVETIQYAIWDTYRQYRFISYQVIQETDDPELKDHYVAQIKLVYDFARDVANKIEHHARRRP